MTFLRDLNRRRFLGLGALAAGAGLGDLIQQADVVEASAPAAAGFDQSFLYKKAYYRQIWDYDTAEQLQTGVVAMKNAMNAFEKSYNKTQYLLIDLRGSAVIYAFDDAMWVKYDLATKYEIFDPRYGGLARRNPLYERTTTDNGQIPWTDSGSLYQDTSLQVLHLRGAHISACADAIGGQAALAVSDKRAHGLTVAQVITDLSQHLVPGAQVTPSGSALIGVAQALGFTYAKQ